MIENIHREDLTNADKGDGVYALLEHFPEKHPTMRSVADSLDVKYKTVKEWCRKSRKLSSKVRKGIVHGALDEKSVSYLLKYSHETQDKLVEVVINNKLTQDQSTNFSKVTMRTQSLTSNKKR